MSISAYLGTIRSARAHALAEFSAQSLMPWSSLIQRQVKPAISQAVVISQDASVNDRDLHALVPDEAARHGQTRCKRQFIF